MMLLDPAFSPFAIAALVLFGLVLIEGIGLLLGLLPSALVDKAIGFDKEVGGDGFGGKEVDADGLAKPHVEGDGASWFDLALAWLNPGRVPFLVLVMAALATFAASGFALQSILRAMVAPLPAGAASLIAAAIAIPGTRFVSGIVGRLIPRDETYAATDHDFIGRVGVVTVGPVQAGYVARGRFTDAHGNPHFLRLKPKNGTETIESGARVKVVDMVDREFLVVRAEPLVASREPSLPPR